MIELQLLAVFFGRLFWFWFYFEKIIKKEKASKNTENPIKALKIWGFCFSLTNCCDIGGYYYVP